MLILKSKHNRIVKELKQSLNASQKQTEGLLSNITALSEERNNLKAQLYGAEIIRKEDCNTIDELKKDLKSLHADTTIIKTQYRNIEGEATRLKEENRKLFEENTSVKSINKTLLKELEEIKKTTAELIKAIETDATKTPTTVTKPKRIKRNKNS